MFNRKYCPNCGFQNQYAFSPPTDCSKCKKSLSFDNIAASKETNTNSTLELTSTERRLIINLKDSSTPLEVARTIFGDSITNQEITLVRNFISSLEAKTKNLVVKSREEDEGDDEDNNEPSSELSDISEFPFSIENIDPPKSMTLEDAIFKYPSKASADILNQPKVKISSKKVFKEIKNKYFPKKERSPSTEIQGL